MKVQVEIDATYKEPEVLIRTSEMTEEISDLMQKLSAANQKVLAGFRGDQVELLDIADIIRIYSADKKIFAQTMSDEFIIRIRLYELEERLDKTLFVRISNTEIVNLKAVKQLDLSLAGTIAITLANGATSYVSRRYLAKIKQVLGM